MVKHLDPVFNFSKDLFHLISVVHMHVYIFMQVCGGMCPLKPEERVGALGVGVTSVCELPDINARI